MVFSTGNGIITRHSADLKTWVTGEPVFKDFPAWHREVMPNQKGHLWAPDVILRGDRYLLYYSVSGWGKNTSAIGLATSPTLDPRDAAYQWKDEGIVIRSSDKDPYYDRQRAGLPVIGDLFMTWSADDWPKIK